MLAIMRVYGQGPRDHEKEWKYMRSRVHKAIKQHILNGTIGGEMIPAGNNNRQVMKFEAPYRMPIDRDEAKAMQNMRSDALIRTFGPDTMAATLVDRYFRTDPDGRKNDNYNWMLHQMDEKFYNLFGNHNRPSWRVNKVHKALLNDRDICGDAGRFGSNYSIFDDIKWNRFPTMDVTETEVCERFALRASNLWYKRKLNDRYQSNTQHPPPWQRRT